MSAAGPSFDESLAAVASRQHGVITRAQALAAGLTAAGVDARVQSGRLRLMHRGVYLLGGLVGSLVPARAKEMAAVLACGRGAIVSHGSAASLWEMVPPRLRSDCVHVIMPGGNRGRMAGICPHRVASVPVDDEASINGIPVTSPSRTLVDIAGSIGPRELEQAVARAERRRIIKLDVMKAYLERKGPRPGSPVLRELIGSQDGRAFTRSKAEERFLALVRRGQLRAPELNVRVGDFEVDFLWREEGVTVEVDGFTFHSSRRIFESDRRRDAKLSSRGYRIVRVTWHQLTKEPEAVLVRLTKTLTQAGHAPQPSTRKHAMTGSRQRS